ncbi:unnamed protein product [Owenia fusiformis]|uniref:Rho GTPase-activating protein 100F n=1 Tax=Owenia fusiformis TaxID=6347 RepID=A0A8S4MY63_OWEFU|nr:unnamed protein product [Owenia fusiformis]
MLCCGSQKQKSPRKKDDSVQMSASSKKPFSGKEKRTKAEEKAHLKKTETRSKSDSSSPGKSPGKNVKYLDTPPSSTGSKRKKSPALDMGIKNMEVQDDDSVIQTVEIVKRPGQTLGFYIREGNGNDRSTGVFISRIAQGSIVEDNGLLRIGDEILSVNKVDVSRMSLDDVVILMSIPKKLVLSIRTQRGISSKSLTSLGPIEPEKPVVVLKGKNVPLENTDKIMEDYNLGRDPRVYPPPQGVQYLPKDFIKSGLPKSFQGYRLGTEEALIHDDSNDSGNSTGTGISEASKVDSPQQEQSKDHKDEQIHAPKSPAEQLISSRGMNGDLVFSDSDTDLIKTSMNKQYQTLDIPVGLPTMSVGSPRSSRKYDQSPQQPTYGYYDYASDSEVQMPRLRRPVNDVHTVPKYNSKYGVYSLDSQQQQPEQIQQGALVPQFGGVIAELQRVQQHGEQQQQQQQRRTPDFTDAYNSDSEVVTMHRGSRPPRWGTTAPVDSKTSMDPEDRSFSLPRMDAGETEAERGTWIQRFENLNAQMKDQGKGQRERISPEGRPNLSQSQTAGSGGNFLSPQDPGVSSEEYWSWLHNRGTQAVPSKFEQTSQASQVNPQKALTRKHSADSLTMYQTYQMPDFTDLPLSHDQRLSALMQSMVQTQRNLTHSLTSSNIKPRPGTEHESRTLPRPSSKNRDLHLSRKPLQLKPDDFYLYRPEGHGHPGSNMNGVISVHIYCGHGLKSSKTVLRDLYCVVQVDSINRARTMIRTGAINFDWDEGFDVELENASDMCFLIYNWDPNRRHRLCFSGNVNLPNMLQKSYKQKVAVRLEPKGIIYLNVVYKEAAVSLQRTPSMKKNAIFGVDLETIVKREKLGTNVPILVMQCIDEIEHRGLDVVGLYRLCGSAKRKVELREEFERDIRKVELSPNSVPDINVVTGILKDFLRELPEPIFTNSLYQMLLDALSVRLPSDPGGSAKLMLSILECLPKANQETLAFLLDHLKKVANRAEANKMTTHNLAVCFGPVLLCPALENKSEIEVGLEFKKHIEVLKYLLEIWPEQRELKSNPATSPQRSIMRATLQEVATGSPQRSTIRAANISQSPKTSPQKSSFRVAPEGSHESPNRRSRSRSSERKPKGEVTWLDSEEVSTC